jgi:cytidine deaminase
LSGTAPAIEDAGISPPPDNELVIGLVAAVGVDLTAVAAELGERLAQFDYRSVDLHLTDGLKSFPWPEELVEEPYDERLWSYMNAGDELRRTWKRKDAMALLGISRLVFEREQLTGDEMLAASRVAYILRSLKRPQEVQLLRQVYGERFLLIGISATEGERSEHLEKRVRQSRLPPVPRASVYSPDRLIQRDEKGLPDDGGFGQDVTGTFHLADCFIRGGPHMGEQIERFFDVLFGDPKRSPLPDEFGMFQAAATAKRSAEMGRQVGAAVCTRDGSVVAVGANEVPKAGGGFYWEGDEGDARDVALGVDASKKNRRELSEQVDSELRKANLLRDDADPEAVLAAIEASPVSDIIEFVRAVHAEMAALTDAARRGVPVAGDTLYVTTFPCHHCARHIVAAGIARVVYVSPYPKSRAAELHGDSLVLGRPEEGDPKVGFEPFVGLGPRRYLDLFDYGERKEDDGSLREYKREEASPRLGDRDPAELRSTRLPYIDREQKALKLLHDAETESGFAMLRPE